MLTKQQGHETEIHRKHLQAGGHTAGSRSNNPAMPQRHNSGTYHPVTDNSGKHNPYFAKTPPVPGDNSHHSDPYRNVIINP